MDIEKRTYTFEYTFQNPNNSEADVTQFCAETKREADNLFKDFLKDEGLSVDIKPENVEVVYNKDDAVEYVNYGTPEDYAREQAALSEMREKLDGCMDLYIMEDNYALRNIYFNPEANDGNGCIEEDVLYYDEITEYMEALDKEDEETVFGLDGKCYCYDLTDAEGYNVAVGFLADINEALNGASDKFVVSSNDKEHNKKLSEFLHSFYDKNEKQKSRDIPEKD